MRNHMNVRKAWLVGAAICLASFTTISTAEAGASAFIGANFPVGDFNTGAEVGWTLGGYYTVPVLALFDVGGLVAYNDFSTSSDDTSGQLKKSLTEAQNEAVELKKELAFYKSIVAPEQGKPSLVVQTIQLNKDPVGDYDYKIMISQQGRNDRFARGTVEVSIEGSNQGAKQVLALNDVSDDVKKPMKFGMKYFQNFTGKLALPQGFAAESVAASVLYTTAYVYEAPISTTHTITSAVMGVGATKRVSAVRWSVARSIVTAWVLTFPAAGSAAALVYFVCKYVFQLP